MTRWVWVWGPAVGWMIAIFAVSSLSVPPPLPGGLSFSGGHFIAYGLLAAWLVRALSGARRSGLVWAAYWQAWGLSSAYGVTDEWHQAFVPSRVASVEDLVADVAGGAAGLGVVWLARWLTTRKSSGAGRAV